MRTHIHAGFEPTIPVFERLKTVRALDCAASGTGGRIILKWILDKQRESVDWIEFIQVKDR
jgi:hypothetical protein